MHKISQKTHFTITKHNILIAIISLISSVIIIFSIRLIEDKTILPGKNIESSFENSEELKNNLSLEKDIQRLVSFLEKHNSPIAEEKYARIIIETSRENDADWRLNVGIMNAESGMCAKPHKVYNCYGYLNGVYYESFEESLLDITTKVSQQYTSVYGYNIAGMAEKYGPHNKEVWEGRVRYVLRNV